MTIHRSKIVVFALAVMMLAVSTIEAREKSESWSFDAAKRVKINTVSGDCVVEPSTTGKIEIEVQWSYRPADSFEPRVRETSSGIRINEKMYGPNRGRSTWFVSVPNEVEIEFSTASGDFTVDGVSGEFSAHTASGDITLKRCGGEFDINSASGDVNVSKCDGFFDVSTASGDIDMVDSKGEFDVSTASGDIDARGLDFTTEGRLTAASGNVDLELASGLTNDLVLSSAFGDVYLDYGGNEMKGKFEFIAKKRRGHIEAPFDFDEEETFRRWGERFVRKAAVRSSDTPLIRLETASGSVELSED
jgi:DUF4097 and DUF4098 domain-containing protein YvlB